MVEWGYRWVNRVEAKAEDTVDCISWVRLLQENRQLSERRSFSIVIYSEVWTQTGI